jgi:hypothetical protein
MTIIPRYVGSACLGLAGLLFANQGLAQNIAPHVFAGPDRVVVLPATSVNLQGFGSDPDGQVNTYAWSKISGGAAAIASAATASTAVTGLAQGTYVFRLTATDAGGAASSDDVQVTVNPAGGKTVVLTANFPDQIYLPDMASLNILPGDTIAISPGSYPIGIVLGGFAGTATNPVKIINHGGLVQAKLLSIANARHFILTGSGGGDQYGFKIGGVAGSTGVAIGRDTSDYEVERVEVGTAGVGFLFKVQPVSGDPVTQHPNRTIANVFIHHNYIHDTGGEGMYIGHTFPNGDINNGDLPPVRMNNVKIYHNLVTNSGWDGIQLSNAREGCEIFNNTVTGYGQQNIGAQRAGIQLGGNTTGRVHGNTIDTGFGPALTAYGYGDVWIYKNTVTNAAQTVNGNEDVSYLSSGSNAIESNPAFRLHFLSNTIHQPKHAAIRNADFNNNSIAGEIRLNTIHDILGRTVNQLIHSYADDVISGNTIYTGNPVVEITSPTTNASWTASSGSLAIAGTSADDGGVIEVKWENLRTGAVGMATGLTSWDATVPLVPGLNEIRVTAKDVLYNTGADTLIVNYIPPVGPLLAAYNCGTFSGTFTSIDTGATYAPDPNAGPVVSGGYGSTLNPFTPIANTEDDALFQSYRWGTHTWSIPVPAAGAYMVKLRFAANPGEAAGNRVFNITMEGVTVRYGFDIRLNPATPANTARDEYIETVVSDGTLNIQFNDVVGFAKVNGIEVREIVGGGLGEAGLSGGPLGSGSAGSSQILPGGEWQIDSTGGPLGGAAESGRFEQRELVGNFRLTTRLQSLSGGSNARAGLMIREGSGAGVRMAFLGAGPSTDFIQAVRAASGGAATVAATGASAGMPGAWMRLERRGAVVTVATSSNGTSFTSTGTFTLPGLTGTLNAGLYVTGAGSNAQAVFDDFTVTPLAVAAYNAGKTSVGSFLSVDDGDTAYLPDPGIGAIVTGGWATTLSPYASISDTGDDDLYQSYRWGAHSWAIPVPAAGIYKVTLRFAANAGETVGTRVFSVAMEGETVIPSLDIRQAAGASLKAHDVTIEIPVTDGTLNIQFANITNNAKINAIKLVPK